jgi:hypothetical protein
MANTIKIKNSGTASNVPASLEYGELGINYADGKLFYKNSSNVIVEFGSSGSLDSLSDVVISSPEEFQTLTYNGTNWVNSFASDVVLARNDELTTITTGTVVYISGTTGDHAKVKRADNDSDSTSATIIGVAGADITSNSNGPIVTLGYVDGLDLSVGYAAGDILWLGEDGAFTKTKPVAPEHLVFIGTVIRATNNGIIFVAPQNGYELDELHNVLISNTLASGDFLKYNGTVWVNDPINLGTDTVGNYMSNVSAGTGITISHTPGEGSTATITNAGVTSVNGSTGAITGVVRTSDTGTVTSTMITDGTIVNGDINASAGIVLSKLASGTAGQIIVANSTGVPTWVTESGDITVDSSGVTSITSNVIVNADINTAAAISHSKLANATAGQVLLGTTTTGVITATTISGDIAITGSGVATIQPNSVALGTDTTGNYVSSLVAGTGVNLSNNSGEGSTPTISIGQSVGTTDFVSFGAVTTESIDAPNNVSIYTETSGTPGTGALLIFGSVDLTGSLRFTVGSYKTTLSSNQTTDRTITIPDANGTIALNEVTFNAKTANYTLALSDSGKMIEMNVGSANNLTVPADNTVNFPVGTSIDILQVGSGQTTIVPDSGVTINRASGLKLRLQWSAATLIKRAANTWVAIGDLSA